MDNIEVFDAEKEDGLTLQIVATSSIAYLSQLAPLDPDTNLARSFSKSLATITVDDPGLYYMQDILVSTDENKNTDFFDREEVWNARATPTHKPLNFEHDDKNIIGHIIESVPVDEDYVVIDNATNVEDLPDFFHILNGSVIYKVWSTPEQEELITATIEEIEAGKWFVSMECTFRGFDFVVSNAEGDKRVIKRDNSSAFLTKHLRQYGGTGLYVDKATGSEYKLARLLRKIAFSGKGLVKRPANPKSVINPPSNEQKSSSEETAISVYQDCDTQTTLSSEDTENNTMSESTDKVYQERISALELEVQGLQKQVSEANTQASVAAMASLKTDVETKATEISQLTTQLDATKATIADLTKRAETAEASEKEAKVELAKVQATQKRSDRLATLVSKGASQEQSESLVAKFENLTDDQFNEMATVLSAAFMKEECEEDKKKKEKDKAATDATKVIDTAQVVDEPALASASETAKAEEARVNVAKWLQQRYLKYNATVKID
jgi:hypothetical protein